MLNKLFTRSGAVWIALISVAYLTAGFLNLRYQFTDLVLLQIGFVVALVLPLIIKPFGRWLNMDV